jgi:hypothetical protein
VTTTPAARDTPDSSMPGRCDLHLRFDAGALLGRNITDFEHRIDEEAETELGRQPAGAGMRRVNETGGLEIRHDVADRGWRQSHGENTRQIARADGITRGEIGLDDLTKDLA